MTSRMRRTALPVSILLLALAFPMRASAATSPSPTPSPTIVVAKVDGSIDRTLARFLTGTIADAERTGATVVVQLDSAGTLDQDAVALAQRVFEARVPVIVWVGPAPAQAAGAGLLLLYASSLAAVGPGVGVGPLLPLDLARPDDARPDTAAIREMVLGWAADRGKPTPTIGRSFPSAPMPAQAAIDQGIAQVAATSIPDLLDEIDGRTVQTAVGPVTLHTRIAESPSEPAVTVRFTELGPIGRVQHAVASPTWIYVLLVLGLAALAFELTQPGFGFAGFGGLAMLALAAYGLTVVPFSWFGLALLLVGVGLMVADVLLRRLGTLTGLGLVAFAAGSWLVFADAASAVDVSPWLIAGAVVGSFLYYGFGLTVAIQSRERITSTQKGLVGLVGEARGELDPEGPVYVKGTLWRGRSANEPIAPGTRIRVRGVDGLILRVEPESED
jgi:membrane-bound serine protease (ClpP class)